MNEQDHVVDLSQEHIENERLFGGHKDVQDDTQEDHPAHLPADYDGIMSDISGNKPEISDVHVNESERTSQSVIQESVDRKQKRAKESDEIKRRMRKEQRKAQLQRVLHALKIKVDITSLVAFLNSLFYAFCVLSLVVAVVVTLNYAIQAMWIPTLAGCAVILTLILLNERTQ